VLEAAPLGIRILEWLLTSLSKVGLDVRTAIRVIGVLFVFVNGFVAAESSGSSACRSQGRRPSVRHPNFAKAVLATGNYPHVKRFIEMTAEIHDDQGFERALNLILNGVASEIQLHERGPRANQGEES
jgi:Tetracyclin repressor-like, C-terminal domain